MTKLNEVPVPEDWIHDKQEEMEAEMVKSNKIRDSARHEECQLRLHPYCNMDRGTTVLAHLPSGSGMGQKSPDICSVYACSNCHDIIDGRFTHYDHDLLPKYAILEAMMQGHFRTLTRMIEKGVITID